MTEPETNNNNLIFKILFQKYFLKTSELYKKEIDSKIIFKKIFSRQNMTTYFLNYTNV
jgi:hypothetical protein